ncbi:DMT family transporter [Jannaschia sp. LMIT008]|uniref:DMT family transporter n=1 Tax=Jannaschia maritima TaxID=3032585 RepID=UPI002811C853|nr:DMT family transporter [Jannaschia sp. LMIT008]
MADPAAPPPGAAPVPDLSDAAERAGTLRGAALMVASMLCFAVEDAFIKTLGGRFGAAQIIWMLACGGGLAFGAALLARGRSLSTPEMWRPRVLVRTAGDVFGGLCFVSAIVAIPLSTASAVIQATPLVVALGAALFLGVRVGPRRWAAIAAGFAGVLLILRPGADSFDPATLLAVGGMLGLAVRDLATRGLPPSLSGVRLSFLAFAAMVPAAVAMHAVQGDSLVVPTGRDLGILGICVVIGMAGYLAVVGATRTGDIAVVSSFRYSRVVFALVIGALTFGERPDATTLAGVAIIVASGLYALRREARARA